MPFPDQIARPFTQTGIEGIDEGQEGCYGLFRAGAWIYVGKADDIRSRLLQHLNGDSPCITARAPASFVTSVTDDPQAVEQELIAEFNPLCNRKAGR